MKKVYHNKTTVFYNLLTSFNIYTSFDSLNSGILIQVKNEKALILISWNNSNEVLTFKQNTVILSFTTYCNTFYLHTIFKIGKKKSDLKLHYSWRLQVFHNLSICIGSLNYINLYRIQILSSGLHRHFIMKLSFTLTK